MKRRHSPSFGLRGGSFAPAGYENQPRPLGVTQVESGRDGRAVASSVIAGPMLGALEPSKLTLRGLAIVRDGRVGSAKLGTMNYHDYLKTDYWKAVSQAVKKRAG